MTTPKDSERTAAFRAWCDAMPSRDAAREAIGVNPRSFDRMLTGAKPPPPRLLEEIADHLSNATLADRLRAAARPATETDHA